MILTLVRCIQLLHADHFSGTVSSRPLPHHLLLLHQRLVLADGAHTVGVYTLAMKDRETGCSRGFGGVEMPDSHAVQSAIHTKELRMPAGPKRRPPPQERHAFGLTVLQPSHPEIRRLQHDAPRPSLHGHKVWPTSFILLDYLHQRGVAPQARVLELGCGWGLVGIACAKTFQAQVTGLDADAAVFPYLQLHAQRHGVHIATRCGTFADLTPQELATFDLIMGADICFWEDLVDPLYQMIRHGVAGGVAEILIADPGRPPFDELCARCVQQGDAEVLPWTMTTPVAEAGQILRVVGAASLQPKVGGARAART